MKKIIFSLILVAMGCLVIAPPCALSAEEDINDTIDIMLAQAEDFFTSLHQGRYEAAWYLLSEESRETIIDDVYQTYQKMGGEIQRTAIAQDFERSGIIFQNYWKAFVKSVDIRRVLDDSRWQAGVMEQHKADIIISHKDSPNPLKLKMVKEHDVWKVGLVETFWNSRTMDILLAILKMI